jgi:hypothetical protein
MKVLKSCMLVVAIITAASGFTGCNTTNDTLEQVTVLQANQIMAKNTTMQFTANGTFTNGMIVTWTQVASWNTDSSPVATVNDTAGSKGIVTSYGINGTTIITAYDVANNITGTALLTVADPESIFVFPANPYTAVNTSYQSSAIALFSNGTITQLITTFATWTTSPPGIATIAYATPGALGNGVVTAGGIPATTIIQANDPISGATGTTILTVKSTPLAALTVSPTTQTIPLGTALPPFTAIGTFQDGTTTPSLSTTWSWSSSNTAVATIDFYSGIPLAVGAGTTTITARDVITGVTGITTLTLQ